MGDQGGDPDWYGYCLDDPVNAVDPLGLQRMEFDRENERLTWYEANGTAGGSFEARSGPYGKGALPEGRYKGTNLRPRTKKGMTCPDGTGWSVDVNTASGQGNGRTDLRVHPDGNVQGTEGCIGIDCKDSDAVENKLRRFFEHNSTIPIYVK